MAVDSAISSIANSSSSYSATSKGKTSGSDLDKEAFFESACNTDAVSGSFKSK